MQKIKVRWSGFVGSPGWSNFYFDGPDGTFMSPADTSAVANRVQLFFQTLAGKFPPTVTFQVQPDVEQISPTDGLLTNVLAGPTLAPVVGSAASANYSSSSGAVVTWRTAGVRNGRRVRGRTFLVPMANVSFANTGGLNPAVAGDITAAANVLADLDGPISLGVWSRPSAKGATDGDWHPVTSVSVPTIGAVLRSRRD